MSHGRYCPFCKFYHEAHSKDCPYGAALRRIAELERQLQALEIGREHARRLQDQVVDLRRQNVQKRIAGLERKLETILAGLERQLETIRNDTLEEAAVVCESERVEDTGHEADRGYNTAIWHCADAIRKLKS